MAADLPVVPSLTLILRRLLFVFPEGTEHRRYLVRDIAARTIFVMFYTGAVEGTNNWIRPNQVTRMTNRQARKLEDESRLAWTKASLSRSAQTGVADRWYAVDTREPIRDETIRSGLAIVGAVIERQGLATTSSKPRYALSSDFAGLFDPQLSTQRFKAAARKWQEENLHPAALARIRLRNRSASASDKTSHVLVTLPNGETRRMEPGPSSDLTKAVIEDFAHRFLIEPAVVFISESGKKVVVEDLGLARSLGIEIKPDRTLPDIILADIAAKVGTIVFVEVVVTDGAITRSRRESLAALATEGGFTPERIVFVTAFVDRSTAAYRRLSSELA